MVLLSKGEDSISDPQNASRFTGTSLPGWAGIENHVVKHDASTVKDHADDIDTLLVFAALFSAILTTFLVETYQSLQPGSNDTTNQLIAYQIVSSQGFQGNMPPTINATISTLLSTSTFTPSATARWINGLFFFSLIISLIAALFGIMAKQWIREYLNWNSPLADPRENVLVRQIRFESWGAWNVDAFIWLIPVLQELAMVLFLVGVVVLVWTLDNAVAIAVTILAAFFLSVFAVITVLPVFAKQCPYKSPTAWAFIRLVDMMRYVALRSYHWVNHEILGRLAYYPLFPRAKTWRKADLEGGWHTKPAVTRQAIKLLLEREVMHLNHNGEFVADPRAHSVSQACIAHCMDDLSEVPVLVRALEWVSRASPGDPQITSCIDQCMNFIHSTKHTYHLCPGEALTNLYACRVWRTQRTRRPRLDLGPITEDDRVYGQYLPSDMITEQRIALGVVASTTGDTQQPAFRLGNLFSLNLGSIYVGDQEGLWLRLLAADLRRVTLDPSGSSSQTWVRDDSQLRRVFEWICMMLKYSLGSSPPIKFQVEWYLDGLRSILNDEAEHMVLLSSKAPGLRMASFILACRHAKVSLDSKNSLVISVGTTELQEYEALLLEYFDLDCQRCPEDDLNMLIFTGWRWLGRVKLNSSPTHTQHMKAVNMIQDALEAALARNTKPHRFLVFWQDLYPFLKAMADTEPGTSWFSSAYISSFTGLIHVMEIYFRKGLFGRWMSRQEFHDMLKKAHLYGHGIEHVCAWTPHPGEITPSHQLSKHHEPAPTNHSSVPLKEDSPGPSALSYEPTTRTSVDDDIRGDQPTLVQSDPATSVSGGGSATTIATLPLVHVVVGDSAIADERGSTETTCGDEAVAAHPPIRVIEHNVTPVAEAALQDTSLLPPRALPHISDHT